MNHRAVYIASNSAQGAWRPIGRLALVNDYYEFVYLKGAETSDGSKYLPGMPDHETVYRSKELFPFFKNRLLSEKRSEYKKFLDWTGLGDTEVSPDPLAILQVTEGKKSTDNYEVFPCPIRQGSDGYYEFKFFLHGTRHLPPQSLEAILKLEINESLRFLADFQNPRRNQAFLLCNADTVALGYLPNYLEAETIRLIDTCPLEAINFSVEKVNANAPAGFSLLCSLRACWSDDSTPFSDEEFKPIPEGVNQSCDVLNSAVA